MYLGQIENASCTLIAKLVDDDVGDDVGGNNDEGDNNDGAIYGSHTTPLTLYLFLVSNSINQLKK